MSQQEKKRPFDPTPLVIAAIDNAIIEDLVASGMTEAQARQQLAEDRQVAACYDELMAQGFTDEQIGILWDGKTTQEILALPTKPVQSEQKVAPRTRQKRTAPQTTLSKTP